MNYIFFHLCFVEIFFDKVRNHLGIGFRDERVPLGDQLLLQRQVILNDAVMHDHDAAGAVPEDVGVRALDGCQHAPGHRRAVHAQFRVHARDDHVEPRQDVLILVERPIYEEVIAGMAEVARSLKVGDVVLINGEMYTGRDNVHAYLMKNPPPVDLRGAALYHCGPVMLQQDGKWTVKAAGPTAASSHAAVRGWSGDPWRRAAGTPAGPRPG